MLATIIIPMYNSEKYIKRTLQSIEAQTYRPIQLVVINDGSTDHSLKICEDYKKQMDFLEVYTTENKGVSHARNEGLKYAKGEYVFFVDSDDLVLPDYIKTMINAGDEDYIRTGIQSTSPEGKEDIRILSDLTMRVQEHRKNFSNIFAQVPTFNVWGCRYKNNIISKKGIKFREDICNGEDQIFNMEYLMNAETIRTISYIGYIYCKNTTSTINRFWPERAKWLKEINKAQIIYGADSPGIGKIKLYGWETALLHYKKYAKYGKDKRTRKIARKLLRETMRDPYFRSGISDIVKYGTIDMKLEAICLKFYIWNLYPALMKLLIKIHNIKK